MKKRVLVAMLLGLTMLLGMVLPVLADGIIIPEPIPCKLEKCPPQPLPMRQLVIKYHHVEVMIDNQVATTKVDQVFYNPNAWPIEGTYTFPLPEGAAVSNFTLWIDGQPVQGKVLSAEQARQVYEEVVRKQRDPALLEYVGRGAVQASIFPIPPSGERRIQLEYRQVLASDQGLVRYTYPLNTEKFSNQPLESVTVSVAVKSSQPIRAIYSPSHPVSIERNGDTQAKATYEASNVLPDTDFSLYYSIGQAEAFHLFTYRDPTAADDPAGFFMLLLAPRPEATHEAISKDVLLIVDRSGSMEGEKFTQAQAAARYILKHLNAEDRFYLTTFSSGTDSYAPNLRPASEVEAAVNWIGQQSANGSTDINRVLLETASVADKERPTYLIFVTDGLPTEGVVESKDILSNFAAAAPGNIRLFSFGVGYDVDTYLLDSLSQEHHGLSTYVKPGENLDEVLSGFYSRISTPVLTNLQVDFGNLETYDLYPNPLPDLFEGSQIVVVGRYREPGTADILLKGSVNGQVQTFRFEQKSFPANTLEDANTVSSLPRLWATRKIGFLLNKIRLQGPDQETIDQIVKLSVRYGIVTPYTSYLVTEPMPLGAENQKRMAEDTYNQMQAQPSAVTGQGAVEKAAGEGALTGADVAPAAPAEAGQLIRAVGSRTFVLTNGVWIDTAYDPDKVKPIPVEFLSEDYFRLAQNRPDAAAVLALGERVIFILDGKVYEVVAAGTHTPPIALPSPLPTATQESISVQATEPPVGAGTVASTSETTVPSPTALPGSTEAPAEPVNPVNPVNSALFCAGLLLIPLAAAGFMRRR